MNNGLILDKANKFFKVSHEKIHALNNVNLSIEKGKLYAIMGHSGAGKSTLIQILGLLDSLSSGDLYVNGRNIKNLSDDEKANVRMQEIGFIFQSFYLNPKLKAIENVMLPMYINPKIKKEDRIIRAKQLLKKFGLNNRIDHYPKELSGGEQQRVAIARALANNPNFILADEPTGNLDIDNEKIVFEMLKCLSREDKAVLVVTHNELITKYVDKILYMNNGTIREDLWRFQITFLFLLII